MKELLNQMKNQKIEKKPTFWTWLHRNRIKVAVLAFVILVPLALIVTAYVGSYTANRKVGFDNEITSETEMIKGFLEPDGIDAFSLNIVWTELKNPELDPDTENLFGGYYKFSIDYVPNENFIVKTVTVIPVLQTDWKNLRSVGTPTAITTIARPVTLVFNHELPFNPLPFVKVSEPHLYLMVEYVLTTGGQDVEFTEYVRFSLKDLNPINVVS